MTMYLLVSMDGKLCQDASGLYIYLPSLLYQLLTVTLYMLMFSRARVIDSEHRYVLGKPYQGITT